MGVFSLDKLNGKLIDANGDVNTEERLKGKRVMLYFSAHWCPPCRGFTPSLVEFYDQHHKDNNFEIIFVTHDRDEKSFQEYFKTMSYMAIKYSEQELINELKEFAGVRGIPTLLLLAEDGSIAIANARGNVTSDPTKFPWGK